ncbi:MAG TPA: hypothetical protein VFD37_03540, partial [Solirubrobacterales bacterium]|nr:hypothetical protein [Solirubrobacterales bacterium]
ATTTVTIRVTRETRDLLAREAGQRGISLSAMLSRLARDMAREANFRSEREARRADTNSTATDAEERDWDSVVGDGIE